MPADLPLCFVLMPFGRKPSAAGVTVDFDAVYAELIAPAIAQAGLEPLRADEELVGGIIHKPMFERLILCSYAIADLTTANANVFYELGVRHALKNASTALIFASGSGPLPFDVGLLRGMPYDLGHDGKPSNAAADAEKLRVRLVAARELATDSPLFQLVDGFPDIAHLKTDVFRERVDYSQAIKRRLAVARQQGLAAVRNIEHALSDANTGLADVEAGILIDLFLSYRDLKGWGDVVALEARMPKHVKATVLVQEQLGLALNRNGDDVEAERVLTTLIAERGPSSETCGILGRVYKDRWEAAVAAGAQAQARGHLNKAIAAYVQGFETDWRDAYPGINAVTLMALKEPPDPVRHTLLPVVRYAVARRIAGGKPDYWDYATELELAVLADDGDAAQAALDAALAEPLKPFQPETTLKTIGLVIAARTRRSEPVPAWMTAIATELAATAAALAPAAARADPAGAPAAPGTP
jgi:hypothetical protein